MFTLSDLIAGIEERRQVEIAVGGADGLEQLLAGRGAEGLRCCGPRIAGEGDRPRHRADRDGRRQGISKVSPRYGARCTAAGGALAVARARAAKDPPVRAASFWRADPSAPEFRRHNRIRFPAVTSGVPAASASPCPIRQPRSAKKFVLQMVWVKYPLCGGAAIDLAPTCRCNAAYAGGYRRYPAHLAN